MSSMGRRTHKKSRFGCTDCKRRHIKCDETRPKCVNCVTAGISCSYINGQAQSSLEQENSKVTPASTSSTENSAQAQITSQQYGVPDDSDPSLNLQQLELLHHYTTSTYKTFTLEPSHEEIFQKVAVKMALSNPFLMYEILAISALHMAYCYPDKMAYYQTKSTELQSLALNRFRMTQQNVNAESAGAVFLFSSLVGLHVLADPMRSRDLPFNFYLDHILESINLMHSARELVVTKWFYIIVESELNPLCQVTRPPEPYNVPDECRKLNRLVENSDLSESSIQAYQGAIKDIHWIYALSEVPYRSHTTIRFLMAWPLQIKADYLKLLNQRRPEALIILAYFGVILHYYRDCWVTGDSGARLVSAINTYVGWSWEEWMAWPNEMVKNTELPPSA